MSDSPRRGTNVRLRQKQVAVRLSPAEYEAVTATAERGNSSAPAVLRNAFLGAIFPAALCEQVQQARNDHYEQAIGHGELSGHEEQEARAYGRVEMCDEVLGWLAPEGER